MSFGEFQDGHLGGHLGCRNETNLAVPPNASHQVSALSDTIQKQMSFQDFQAGHNGSHLGHWSGTNLAILNLHVTPMPPTKFELNPTCSRADVV